MRLFEIPQVRPGMPATRPVETAMTPTNPGLVKQQPIQNFGGDILVPASSDVIIDATLQFSDRCTGVIFQLAIGTVQVSINGSAFRTITNDQVINDAFIRQIRVKTDALSSIIVQLHGV